MELVDKIQTWWESLGLSKEEADIVDEAIAATKPVPHPKCENCANTVDPNHIHDCRGIYDEVRVFLGEKGGNIARSTKNRLSKKYNCEYGTETMYERIHAYREKNIQEFEQKVKEFQAMRDDKVLRAQMLEYDWDAEQELWDI